MSTAFPLLSALILGTPPLMVDRLSLGASPFISSLWTSSGQSQTGPDGEHHEEYTTTVFLPVLRPGLGVNALGDEVGFTAGAFLGVRGLTAASDVVLGYELVGGYLFHDVAPRGQMHLFTTGLGADLFFGASGEFSLGVIGRGLIGLSTIRTSGLAGGFQIGGRLGLFLGLAMVEMLYEETWAPHGWQSGAAFLFTLDLGVFVVDGDE